MKVIRDDIKTKFVQNGFKGGFIFPDFDKINYEKLLKEHINAKYGEECEKIKH